MSQPTPLFVGLDVYKDSIAVAHAQGQSADPPVFVGGLARAQADLDLRLPLEVVSTHPDVTAAADKCSRC